MDSALNWSAVEPFQMDDATHTIWAKDFILHKPLPPAASTSAPTKTGSPAVGVPESVGIKKPAPPTASSTSAPTTASSDITRPGSVDAASGMRIFTPMKPPEKRKGRASDTFDQRHCSPDKQAHVPSRGDNDLTEPAGCRWSNNSCAYDAITFVLYNTWNADREGLRADFAELGNQWMDMATTAFHRFTRGEYTLEEVRDYLRRGLSREHPREFVFGVHTSVEALTMRMFRTDAIFSVSDKVCASTHSTPVSSQQCCMVVPHSTAPLRWNTLQQFLDNTLSVPSGRAQCETCDLPMCERTTYNIAPPLLCLAVAFTDIAPELSIHLTTSLDITMYRLAGIVYYGVSHFTARYIDSDLMVWFNDGMIQGRRAAQEGVARTVNLAIDPNGKKPDSLIYVRS
ncbi:hypothetical protein IW262DRAFT_1465208 [Armillaria fumosa]|nr:hypothetical protein IW262DRAFT_1465208 [Armillaria fumosa]